jgi:hypothetical protein
MSLSKETSSYSDGERLAALRIVTESEEWAEIQAHKRQRISPQLMSLARTASGGATSDTIRNWLNTDNNKNTIKERLSRRGRKKKLSEDLLAVIVGFAVDLRLNLKAVNAQHLIDFAHGYFNRNIEKQRISEIMESFGFSSQLSMERNSRMTDEAVAMDSLDFILQLRKDRKQFKRLLVMDETGLWSNVVQRLTYHFVNWYKLLYLSPEVKNKKT